MADNRYTPNPRTYTKRNFVEVLELITPEVYKTEDIALSGLELDPISDIINRHVTAAANIPTVLSISAVANSQTSTLDSISGIGQYFVKQNELTKINNYLFETKILNPLSSTFVDFTTSSSFNTYLSTTLLPKIQLAQAGNSDVLEENISFLSSLTSEATASSVHNYLVDALGWFYFLNTSADGGLDWEPSGYVLSSLQKLYIGENLETIDGVRGLQEYVWRNYSTCTPFSTLSLLPPTFTSGAADAIVDSSAGIPATYTSGTQKLDNLQTLVDVIYSPLFIDQQDYRVQEALDDYIDAGTALENLISKGPLRKFFTAMGFSMADITNQVENIGLIYDIENTKDEHLRYIADLIGWELFGNSPAKWREQLRIAIEVYKRKGTKAALNYALSSILSNTFIDVGAKVQELWESYIPFLIWYALATESPYFESLNTWTEGKANQAGVPEYNTSSLEENIKLVTDYILLDLYKKFPDNFIFHKDKFPVSKLIEVKAGGCIPQYNKNHANIYTISYDPLGKPFHVHLKPSKIYKALKADAKHKGNLKKWKAALSNGPLGHGVYMAELSHLDAVAGGKSPVYLSATGDKDFVFNYRGHVNFPMPPFEEMKYYRECILSPALVKYLKNRLICFGVSKKFARQLEDFILKEGINTNTNLGSLNEFLMLFSSTQVPPNYDDVLFNISKFDKNILGLWNGKSSHIFIDFNSEDFDFTKVSLEGDGRYGLYETARVTKKLIPAHTIPKINLNASAVDAFVASSTKWIYAGLDKDDTPALYSSGAVLVGFENSGVAMGSVSPGNNDGRGGLNTFKREDVDSITDVLFSSTTAITTTPRRSLRRRNFRYTLPLEGYYDRTAFNPPVSWDSSTLENSFVSSLGELTLGYVLSSQQFCPIVDPINPSGVWHICEDLDSPRIFSGVDTSNTFPYRGLQVLGSDAKNTTYPSAVAKYVDRGQTPPIYITMHQMFEDKAINNAEQIIKNNESLYLAEEYWKNNIQSLANEAIASGFVLNSFADYQNFTFGKGLHRLHQNYCTLLGKHPINPNEADNTGGNIFGHVFGDGLYNDNFSVEGSAVSSLEGNYLASSVDTAVPIAQNNGSGVFTTCAVAAYGDGIASGTYIASDLGQTVIPLQSSPYKHPFSITLSGGDGDPSFIFYEGAYVVPAINNLQVGSVTAIPSVSSTLAVEFRNPHILSGIEFVDISGSPTNNKFLLFQLTPSDAINKLPDYLTNNPVIKCKSVAGLPRLRFDLSSYGPRPNRLVKDHSFKLGIEALVAEGNSTILGGGKLGVWIHTDPHPATIKEYELSSISNVSSSLFETGGKYSALGPSVLSSIENDYMWTWTPEGKWVMHTESEITIDKIFSDFAHFKDFKTKTQEEDAVKCLGNIKEHTTEINNISLKNIQKEFFETFEVEFDTRNYSIYNNYEYMKVIPIPDAFNKLSPNNLVHKNQDTNYVVEIFFKPQSNLGKYLLIDSINLTDLTQRENASIPTGYGLATSGIPLRPLVGGPGAVAQTDKLYLDKGQLMDTLNFFNGLIASGPALYNTNLASRDAIITSGTMEVSGGSRLNYRISPIWVSGAADGDTNQITQIDIIN